jgi:hypothetical protein
MAKTTILLDSVDLIVHLDKVLVYRSKRGAKMEKLNK